MEKKKKFVSIVIIEAFEWQKNVSIDQLLGRVDINSNNRMPK